MKQFLALFAIAFLWLPSISQPLTSADLIEDVEALNQAVIKAHPITLNAAFVNPLPAILDSLKMIENRSYEKMEYHFVWRKILSRLGCYHTNIYPPKIPAVETVLPHFPYKVWSDGINLYLMAPSNDDVNTDDFTYPMQVFAINDIPVKEFLPSIINFKASDGHQKTNGIWYLNKYGTLLVREYFRTADSFNIKLRDRVITERPQDRVYSLGYTLDTESYLDSSIHSSSAITTYHLKRMKRVAYTRISTFAYSDGEAIARSTVQKLNEAGKRIWIIDIRGNGGGKANNANVLASYFTNESITGSDIIPKHKNGNGIGFSWAKIGLRFWQAVNIHRSEKGPNKQRIYSFEREPAAEQFKGQVYVLIDGRTGSTASQFASIMQHQCGAIIVGEETGGGDGATNAGSYSKFKLPASGLVIRFPLVRSTSDLGIEPKHGGVTPDLPFKHSARSISEQKDKVLESVIQHIKTKK